MSNFTPIFESIISLDDIKLADAAIFGVVWRYCQMDKGLCNAAPDTMADKIGVSTKTVRRSLAVLVGKNLIQDLTPGRRNDTHEYVLTSYAREVISKNPVGQNDQPNDDRLDKMTNPVGQNDQPWLDKMSNEESLLRDSLRESTLTLDPLGHIVEAAQAGVSPEPAPYEIDQWWGYRDKFLQVYSREFPRVRVTQPIKDEIVGLANRDGADPARWEKACRETVVNWSGNGSPPLQRVIEVYEAGGTWADWKKATYGNGQHPPKEKRKFVDPITGKVLG